MDPVSFASPALYADLAAADDAALDALCFGVVAMNSAGVVTSYNSAEAELSGLTPSRVIGRHFFSAVAPCTNNFMVAQRFETEAALDATIDYVFTLKMTPTPVRLRLLKASGGERMFLAVERRL